MSTEENKAIARRWAEELWKGNQAIFDECIAANCDFHGSSSQQLQAIVNDFRHAFPDVTLTVEEMIAEEDKVVTRWTIHGTHTGDLLTPYGRVSPTGKHVTYTGITINRLADGKIVDDRFEGDVLGLLQQVGALPTPTS